MAVVSGGDVATRQVAVVGGGDVGYSFHIGSLSKQLVKNKKVLFKKTYQWQGLETQLEPLSIPLPFWPCCGGHDHGRSLVSYNH